jgi:Fe-S cluster assembly ATP-binding protein
MSLLEIKNLTAKLADEDKQILNGLNLTVEKGQVAAIMGPNGSGKSTLSYVLAGREDYEVTDGEALLDGENILELSIPTSAPPRACSSPSSIRSRFPASAR